MCGGVYRTLDAGEGAGGQAHGICYAIDQQGGKSNAGYAEDVMMTLCSDSHGTPHGVCYVLEGNTIDREAKQNGRGWCEDVSPTLNSQDKHAVVFTIGADSSNSMKSANPNSGIHETDRTKCLDTGCLNPQCNQGGVLVCYAVDCRNGNLNREKSATLQAKGQGGWSVNVTNPVLMENET